jgi:hypothetical protein
VTVVINFWRMFFNNMIFSSANIGS